MCYKLIYPIIKFVIYNFKNADINTLEWQYYQCFLNFNINFSTTFLSTIKMDPCLCPLGTLT
jgi:hypothetical protein